MRIFFIFLALFVAFGANAQEDSLTRKRSVRIVDFNHPKNHKIKNLPWTMLNSAWHHVIWAYKEDHYKESFRGIELLNTIGFDTTSYTCNYSDDGSDSIDFSFEGTLKYLDSDTCFKKLLNFQPVAKVKFILEEVYNQEGILQNRVYTSESINNDYRYKEPPIIKFIIFMDEKGNNIAYFDYVVVGVNVMVDNPRCWHIDKKNKKYTQYFDLLEQGKYHYEEVKK